MKRSILAGLAVVLTCWSLVAWTQEPAKTTKPASKSEEKRVTNRLPAHFGKLGLTDAQKDKVYAVQDRYEKQIDDLESQIKSIKTKRDGEIEAVLSPEQKKILKDLMEEAKEAKSKTKKAAVENKEKDGKD